MAYDYVTTGINEITSYAGGFVGQIIDKSTLNITRSYTAGTVTSFAQKEVDNALSSASRYAGGLLGWGPLL